jgi:hypothetical protein
MIQYFGQSQLHLTERAVEMQISKSESYHANNLGVISWLWRHTDRLHRVSTPGYVRNEYLSRSSNI